MMSDFQVPRNDAKEEIEIFISLKKKGNENDIPT